MKKNMKFTSSNLLDAALEAFIDVAYMEKEIKEIKEKEAKTKATKAAMDVYNKTIEKELGHSWSIPSSGYRRIEATKIMVPAKKSEPSECVKMTTRMFVKPEWAKIIEELNPNLFMREFTRIEIMWPLEASCYIVQTEQVSYGHHVITVQTLVNGHLDIMSRESVYFKTELKNKDEEIACKFARNGYVEI